MRPSLILRTLTLWGWFWLVAAALAIGWMFLQAMGFRWDPFRMAERRLRAAETGASVALDDATARRLEVEGAAAQGRRLEAHHQQSVTVARETVRVATEARRADDADTPLDPDRRARLAAHDRELCRLAPAVCGAAAAEPAGSSDPALRAGAAAGRADDRRS